MNDELGMIWLALVALSVMLVWCSVRRLIAWRRRKSSEREHNAEVGRLEKRAAACGEKAECWRLRAEGGAVAVTRLEKENRELKDKLKRATCITQRSRPTQQLQDAPELLAMLSERTLELAEKRTIRAHRIDLDLASTSVLIAEAEVALVATLEKLRQVAGGDDDTGVARKKAPHAVSGDSAARSPATRKADEAEADTQRLLTAIRERDDEDAWRKAKEQAQARRERAVGKKKRLESERAARKPPRRDGGRDDR